MSDLFSFVFSPLPFILMVSVVITVHELGHYWAGRMFNAAAESFSVGFGNPIFEVKDKRGTRWRLNWIPLGGFVKFVGEMQVPQDSRTAINTGPVGKPYPQLGPLKRLVVSLAGPFANFVFAIVVFGAIGFSVGVPTADNVRVAAIRAGTPAEAAGFKVGDIVLKAGERVVHSATDLVKANYLSAGEEVEYSILRDGQPMTIIAAPRKETEKSFNMEQKVGQIGVTPQEINPHFRRLSPIEAVGYGFTETRDRVGDTIQALRRLVTGRDGLENLSGPVGILTMTDNVTDQAMKQEGVNYGDRLALTAFYLVNMAAMFSIGVGFFNLLPIPVLDGGAAVMCVAEAITGREIPEKVQRVGVTIGLVSLICFAFVITWHDIVRSGGALEGLSKLLS